MLVWATVVVVVVGPSFPLYSNSYVPRGVAVAVSCPCTHVTFTRMCPRLQSQTSFLLFLFVVFVSFVYR
ncbi:hypothetical protein V8E53_011566 [Lactarius tabidus]